MRNLTRGAGIATITIILGVAGLGQASATGIGSADSDATAVDVAPLDVQVGHAQADAGNQGGSTQATALRVAGNSFGTHTTDPNSSESIIAVPAGNGQVRVAPRETTTTSSGGTTTTTAYAALADAQIPGLVRAQVLSGNARAVWTPQGGSSSASSDAASVDLAGGSLVVVLLHSEGSSDGSGRLYLVRLNQTTVGDTRSQEPVTIEVPGVVTAELLATNASARSFRGQVVDVMVLQSPDTAQILSRVAAQQSAAPVREPGSGDPTVDTKPTVKVKAAGALPFTGAQIQLFALVGMLMVLGGAGLLGARRLIHTAAP